MSNLLPKPPWACYVWCDDRNIYLEQPCPVGRAPIITTLSKTEGGFAKAIAIVAQCANKDRSPPPPGYFRHGEAKVVVLRTQPALKPNLAEATQRVLKRMGMV
jgi:hypothetical protein